MPRLPVQLRLSFTGVRAIGARVFPLDVLVDQHSVPLELGCRAQSRRASRKSALVHLAGVPQHVLPERMSAWMRNIV